MANHTNDMWHWLEKKVKACEDFLSATVLLKAALEAEKMATVNDLIGRRRALMRVIDGLDRRIGDVRNADSPDKNQRMPVLFEDLKRVLKRIVSENQGCDAIAAGRCEGFRKELINTRRKEEGIHGYGGPKEKMQKFLNIRT